MAEVAQVVVKAMGDLTPEQRAVIEFLAENPEVAEAFQELNQKLARQRAIGGATKETAQPAEPLIKDEKIRRIVRALFDVWEVEDVKIDSNKYFLVTTIEALGKGLKLEIPNININGVFKLVELCGEETPEPLEPSFIDLSERIKEKEEE